MSTGAEQAHTGPARVRDAWDVLAQGAPACATALVDIAQDGKSELARVQAATAVLDRVGLAPVKEVAFRVMPQEGAQQSTLSPGAQVRARLANLSAQMSLPAGQEHAPEEQPGQVLDAEIVGE